MEDGWFRERVRVHSKCHSLFNVIIVVIINARVASCESLAQATDRPTDSYVRCLCLFVFRLVHDRNVSIKKSARSTNGKCEDEQESLGSLF